MPVDDATSAAGVPRQRSRRRRRWTVVAVLAGLAAVGLVVGLVVGWPHVQAYTGSAPPRQVDQALDPPLPPGHAPVLGVAHNAGNNPDTTARALDNEAAVIEIDVISARGQLSAGRQHSWQWLAERVFRGPTLAEAWDAAATARVVKLDLQQNDRALLDQLVTFLRERAGPREVMVSTRDPGALTYLRPRLPRATLLLSLAFPDAVHRLMADPATMGSIDGVSVFQGLVDRALVTWAHRNGLVVLAWTVDDGRRLGQLVGLGVDGITTANLAVLRSLA